MEGASERASGSPLALQGSTQSGAAIDGGGGGAAAPPPPPKALGICCVCPETKLSRDECVVRDGPEACQKYIEAHKACLRAEGFKV